MYVRQTVIKTLIESMLKWHKQKHRKSRGSAAEREREIKLFPKMIVLECGDHKTLTKIWWYNQTITASTSGHFGWLADTHLYTCIEYRYCIHLLKHTHTQCDGMYDIDWRVEWNHIVTNKRASSSSSSFHYGANEFLPTFTIIVTPAATTLMMVQTCK